MSQRVEPVGVIATRSLEEAIAASGCKDKQLKLAKFLAWLKKGKGPEGLSVSVQQLSGGRILIIYEDLRSNSKNDGYAIFRPHYSQSEFPVKITWRPTFNGRLCISPELELGLERTDSHQSDYSVSLYPTILEFFGVGASVTDWGYFVLFQPRSITFYN